MTTPVPPLTDIPAFPALADRAAGTYNSKAYAFGTHMADVFNSEMLALANNVLDNADDAAASAASASDDAAAAALSAGSASDSAAAAVSAANSAVAAFDNFDDRYLGAKASDPTTDNDGNALIVGALYFNSGGGGGMRAWNGAAWEAAYLPASGYQTTLVSGTNIKTVNGLSILGAGNLATGPRNYAVVQYTASATFVVPPDTYTIRPYTIGAGAAGNGSTLGGAGGGCAYGDIAVTPGQSVALSISAGVAKVSIGGVDLLIANPGTAGSGGAGGTATKHASVTNGGAYAGGAGASFSGARGGSSSGSPLGPGVTNTYATTGGAGWGGQGGPGVGTGGGVGGPGTTTAGGPGLPLDSTDPLLRGLTGLGGMTGTATNQNGGNGGPGAGGGAPNGTGIGGQSGMGAGGAANGGVAGFGGGAGAGSSSLPGFGGGGQGATAGAAVIRIYY